MFDGAAIKQESRSTPSKSSFLPKFIPADRDKDVDAHRVITNAGSAPVTFLPVNPGVNTIVNTFNATNTSDIDPFLESDEAETSDATSGFYGGYAVEESPSPFHAPNVDEDAGFGDIRDGCEQFPEQWTHEETQAEVVTPHNATARLAESKDLEPVASKPLKPFKQLLQPKSQIAKAARTCDMGFGFNHRASYAPPPTARSGFSIEVLEQINGMTYKLFFLTLVTDIHTGTKRPARDSDVTFSKKDSQRGVSPLSSCCLHS